MDQSSDTLAIFIPSLCISLVEVHVLLPCVFLPQTGTSDNNRLELSSFKSVILNYSNNQLLDPSSQNGAYQAMFLFETKEILSKDAKNINTSLMKISNYIKNHLVNNKVKLSSNFVIVAKSLQDFINTIYTLKQDILIFNKEKKLTINKYISSWFGAVPNSNTKEKSLTFISANPKENMAHLISTSTPPSVVVSPIITTPVILPSIKNSKTIIKKAPKSSNIKKSYMQASKTNILPNIEGIL